MPSLQKQITEKFLTELSTSKEVTPEIVEKLTELLASGKKIKPDDLAAIFATPPGGEVA